MSDIQLYRTELIFSLPEATTDEQLDQLHDRVATQYSDVSSVRAGICNPPLIVIQFSDVPTQEQVDYMILQLDSLLNL